MAEPTNSRSERASVMLMAQMWRAGGAAPEKHRVLNLSATGICISRPEGLAVPDSVTLLLGRADPAAAEVVWVRGGLAGLRFAEPIDMVAARAKVPTVTAPRTGWMADAVNPYLKS